LESHMWAAHLKLCDVKLSAELCLH
jgi:hypothetical protein